MIISAVIPAFNAEQYIGRAIDSALAQSRPVDEIIVVDDGSTDGTAAVIAHYGDKVRYFYQDNAGASVARNTGIEAAQGDWIAFLDGDDEWLPGKIRLQTELLAQCPDLVWTTGNYIKCLCEENRAGAHTTPAQCMRFLKGKQYYNSYFEAFQLYQWGHTDCMLIRRDVLEECGLFRAGQLKANDIDMWLRIAYRYPKIGFSAEPLAIYHLSVADSIIKKYRTADIYTDFIERHLSIAEREGMLQLFRPAAGFMMRRWIRGMLFEARKSEIRKLIGRFPELFARPYRMLMFGLTQFPIFTARVLHLLSKIIRIWKLRRHITPKPPSFTR